MTQPASGSSHFHPFDVQVQVVAPNMHWRPEPEHAEPSGGCVPGHATQTGGTLASSKGIGGGPASALATMHTLQPSPPSPAPRSTTCARRWVIAGLGMFG